MQNALHSLFHANPAFTSFERLVEIAEAVVLTVIAFALMVPPVGVGLVPFLTVGLSSTAGLLAVVFTIRMAVARALAQVPVVT